MSGLPPAPALAPAPVQTTVEHGTRNSGAPVPRPNRRADTAWMDFARVAGMLAVVTVHVISPAMLYDLTDKNSGRLVDGSGRSTR